MINYNRKNKFLFVNSIVTSYGCLYFIISSFSIFERLYFFFSKIRHYFGLGLSSHPNRIYYLNNLMHSALKLEKQCQKELLDKCNPRHSYKCQMKQDKAFINCTFFIFQSQHYGDRQISIQIIFYLGKFKIFNLLQNFLEGAYNNLVLEQVFLVSQYLNQYLGHCIIVVGHLDFLSLWQWKFVKDLVRPLILAKAVQAKPTFALEIRL